MGAAVLAQVFRGKNEAMYCHSSIGSGATNMAVRDFSMTLCTAVFAGRCQAGILDGPRIGMLRMLRYPGRLTGGHPIESAVQWVPLNGMVDMHVPGPSACARGAICMLFMMSGILCSSALPCSVCGIGTLPCSVLLKTPCSCLCGSATLWGWHTSSRIVLRCLVP